MTQERRDLIAFLEKRQYRREPVMAGNLPDPAAFPHPTVTLFKEQLAEFRSRYAELVAFAANLCGVPLEQVNLINMIRHLSWRDVLDETVRAQVEDEALWAQAQYISEAYVQQELRKLHAVIEQDPVMARFLGAIES